MSAHILGPAARSERLDARSGDHAPVSARFSLIGTVIV
jgi:hypothetical protein